MPPPALQLHSPIPSHFVCDSIPSIALHNPAGTRSFSILLSRDVFARLSGNFLRSSPFCVPVVAPFRDVVKAALTHPFVFGTHVHSIFLANIDGIIGLEGEKVVLHSESMPKC